MRNGSSAWCVKKYFRLNILNDTAWDTRRRRWYFNNSVHFQCTFHVCRFQSIAHVRKTWATKIRLQKREKPAIARNRSVFKILWNNWFAFQIELPKLWHISDGLIVSWSGIFYRSDEFLFLLKKITTLGSSRRALFTTSKSIGSGFLNCFEASKLMLTPTLETARVVGNAAPFRTIETIFCVQISRKTFWQLSHAV